MSLRGARQTPTWLLVYHGTGESAAHRCQSNASTCGSFGAHGSQKNRVKLRCYACGP